MVDTFDELLEEHKETDKNEEPELVGGDTCPEDEECDKDLIERRHPRNSQLDTDRNPKAPEVELVCTHHGIVASR